MDLQRKADTPVGLGAGLSHLPATMAGHCPNCTEGKVFKNAVNLKETCEYCGVRFERDGGSHMISMVLNYFLSLIITGVVALVLILRYGFFSGATFAFAGLACLCIVILFRPTKLLYLWLLWLFGFVYQDPQRGRSVARADA